MTTATSATNDSAVVLSRNSVTRGFALSEKVAAYKELAKARIAVMVLFSMSVGYLLGSAGDWQILPLLSSAVGVFFAVVASSSFNQLIERSTDAKMPRTAQRPLPAGRLTSNEVFWFSLCCSLGSTAFLALAVNGTTALLTLLTTVLYAAVYTPLKRLTSVCTAIGAIPGAMPPVIGWVAAGGQLDGGAFALFAILFVWQFPHFLAIAWMYREQYAAAGLKMVPGNQRQRIVGPIALGYALILIPVSLVPRHLGLVGDFYVLVAIGLGLVYLGGAIVFYRHETRVNARRLLFASLFYLPGVLLAMMVDHIRLIGQMS